MATIKLLGVSTFVTFVVPDDSHPIMKDVQALYDLYTAAEDAGAEARDEVASLKDEIDMKQFSNDAIDKEAGELRAEVTSLECQLEEKIKLYRETHRELRYAKEAIEQNNTEASDEVSSLQDDLEISRGRSSDLEQVVGDLREKVMFMEWSNKVAIGRCNEKQRIIEAQRRAIDELQQRPNRAEIDKLKASLKEAGLKLIELGEL